MELKLSNKVWLHVKFCWKNATKQLPWCIKESFVSTQSFHLHSKWIKLVKKQQFSHLSSCNVPPVLGRSAQGAAFVHVESASLLWHSFLLVLK